MMLMRRKGGREREGKGDPRYFCGGAGGGGCGEDETGNGRWS